MLFIELIYIMTIHQYDKQTLLFVIVIMIGTIYITYDMLKKKK